MVSTGKSLELFEKAKEYTTGLQSNLISLERGAPPLFIVSGKGAHLWDVDDNEYIDYAIAAGPGILGHGNEDWIRALSRQLETLVYSATWCPPPTVIELAQKFREHVPCAQKVRFLLSGTEAVQMAIRIARAYTGRRYFIRFEGHYHGWLDNVLGGLVNDRALDRPFRPFALESNEDPMTTEGRDSTTLEQSFKLPWNDIEVLERVLKKYGQEVAMIHMEPILCNLGACPPRPGYLERVRELCTKYGIILSFDEIITGFRVGLGGAQKLLEVTPDLATFGKAMAGGIPLSAVAGNHGLFDLFIQQRVVGAGTFNGYPFGLAAALTTIKILEENDGALYKHVDRVQDRLMTGLGEIGKRRGLPLLIQGPRGVFVCEFIDREVAYNPRDLKGADVERQRKFRQLLQQKGIIIYHGRWHVSAAISEEDVDKTLEVANWAMGQL